MRSLLPRLPPATSSVAYVGLALQTASLTFAIWARRHLATYWCGAITIQAGPYGSIRHPIYAAILGMFVGSAISPAKSKHFSAWALPLLLDRRKIRLEEAAVRAAFGPVYDRYCRRTGSLLPRLTGSNEPIYTACPFRRGKHEPRRNTASALAALAPC